MIPVLSSTRPIARRWRIMRSISTPAGQKLIDTPFWQGDSFSLHAPTAEAALANAKRLLPVWLCKGLVAISEES